MFWRKEGSPESSSSLDSTLKRSTSLPSVPEQPQSLASLHRPSAWSSSLQNQSQARSESEDVPGIVICNSSRNLDKKHVYQIMIDMLCMHCTVQNILPLHVRSLVFPDVMAVARNRVMKRGREYLIFMLLCKCVNFKLLDLFRLSTEYMPQCIQLKLLLTLSII